MHPLCSLTPGWQRGFTGPSRRRTHPCPSKTHHPPPSPLSRAPLGAGGGFGSQCKYIFSLSKTHFPTTVKGEEGSLSGGERVKEREREGKGENFPPLSSAPAAACRGLTSGTVYHLACWFRQEERGWKGNTAPTWRLPQQACRTVWIIY